MRLLATVAVNALGWPAIHVALSWFFLRLPDRYFAEDSWLTAERGFERKGQIYRSAFAIQRVKRLLPDGSPWLGGRSKKHINGRDQAELRHIPARNPPR